MFDDTSSFPFCGCMSECLCNTHLLIQRGTTLTTLWKKVKQDNYIHSSAEKNEYVFFKQTMKLLTCSQKQTLL